MLVHALASLLTLAVTPAQAAVPTQPAAAASTAETAAPAPAQGAARRICRRFTPTGSTIASKRECRTAAEWDRLAERAQNQGRDVVERARSGLAGN